MKKLFFLILLMGLFSLSVKAQSDKMNLDFVIAIDNTIPPTLFRTKVQLIYTNDSVRDIEVYYHPGMLSFKKSDYAMLIGDKVKSANLKFSYYKGGKHKQVEYDYEIELKKSWLGSLYTVINVYNLDIKPYKKMYEPLSKDKNYTFELLSPDFTFTRVRKK
jgi:hypothetical protein